MVTVTRLAQGAYTEERVVRRLDYVKWPPVYKSSKGHSWGYRGRDYEGEVERFFDLVERVEWLLEKFEPGDRDICGVAPDP